MHWGAGAVIFCDILVDCPTQLAFFSMIFTNMKNTAGKSYIHTMKSSTQDIKDPDGFEHIEDFAHPENFDIEELEDLDHKLLQKIMAHQVMAGVMFRDACALRLKILLECFFVTASLSMTQALICQQSL